MSINKINFNYFVSNKHEEQKDNIVFSYDNSQWLGLIKNDKLLSWEYFGFIVIRCQNTNKAIKELLYKDRYSSNIKINDKSICISDVIIISPFTRISDVLSDKSNANLHSYLKQNDSFKLRLEIEQFIVSKLNLFKEDIDELVEYDLSKSDLINFIDIKDDFIDKNNFIKILNVLKSYDQKKLIIFNDVDYIDFNELSKYIQYFDFLYFVNEHDEEYTKIENYESLLIEYDGI